VSIGGYGSASIAKIIETPDCAKTGLQGSGTEGDQGDDEDDDDEKKEKDSNLNTTTGRKTALHATTVY
jgi:hypothetical protein